MTGAVSGMDTGRVAPTAGARPIRDAVLFGVGVFGLFVAEYLVIRICSELGLPNLAYIGAGAVMWFLVISLGFVAGRRGSLAALAGMGVGVAAWYVIGIANLFLENPVL